MGTAGSAATAAGASPFRHKPVLVVAGAFVKLIPEDYDISNFLITQIDFIYSY